MTKSFRTHRHSNTHAQVQDPSLVPKEVSSPRKRFAWPCRKLLYPKLFAVLLGFYLSQTFETISYAYGIPKILSFFFAIISARFCFVILSDSAPRVKFQIVINEKRCKLILVLLCWARPTPSPTSFKSYLYLCLCLLCLNVIKKNKSLN